MNPTDAQLADMATDARNDLLEALDAALAADMTERRIEAAEDQARFPE